MEAWFLGIITVAKGRTIKKCREALGLPVSYRKKKRRSLY